MKLPLIIFAFVSGKRFFSPFCLEGLSFFFFALMSAAFYFSFFLYSMCISISLYAPT